MTPAILRTVLILAAIFSAGVIANVFSNQQAGSHMRGAREAGQGIEHTKTTRVTAALDRAAAQHRTVEGVRRQLLDRGYLPSALAAVPGNSLPIRAAILAFEYDYELALTATPTDAVLEALIFTHAKTATTLAKPPATEIARGIISEVQRALDNLGYGPTGQSGALDPATKAAITKFERARGLQASGRISAPLIESLGPALNRTALDAGAAAEQSRKPG